MLEASLYSKVSSLFEGDGDGVVCLVVDNGVEALGEELMVPEVLGFEQLVF